MIGGFLHPKCHRRDINFGFVLPWWPGWFFLGLWPDSLFHCMTHLRHRQVYLECWQQFYYQTLCCFQPIAKISTVYYSLHTTELTLDIWFASVMQSYTAANCEMVQSGIEHRTFRLQSQPSNRWEHSVLIWQHEWTWSSVPMLEFR